MELKKSHNDSSFLLKVIICLTLLGSDIIAEWGNFYGENQENRYSYFITVCSHNNIKWL